ncbi:four helix bundle protein [Candidatus Microgenomates bacterium]|nr:four helix bundle protein [Candidatus Microgenomates bacterium]
MESYKKLATYVLATVIFDLTVEFCRRWIDPKSRTTDQMTQAARSGKQNIAEGASVQSLESYIKLLGVTEGSQRELASDYEDFLRQRGLPIWDKEDARVRRVRQFRAVWVQPNQPNTPNLPKDPTEAANTLLTFCQMETFLLKRQIEALKEKFVMEGGFRENLFKKRMEFKKK